MPIIIVVLALAGREVDLDKLIKFDIKFKLVWLFFILSLYYTGFLQGVSDYYGREGYIRFKQSMGFKHPNIFPMFVFIILTEYIYIRFEKLKSYEWIGVLGIWFLICKLLHQGQLGILF